MVVVMIMIRNWNFSENLTPWEVEESKLLKETDGMDWRLRARKVALEPIGARVEDVNNKNWC